MGKYGSATPYFPNGLRNHVIMVCINSTINASASTQYAFVAVDATLDYGLSRFFNFIGILDQPEKLVEFQTRIENDPKINGSIWFGHYPTSSISTLFSTGPTLREIAAKGIVYLCGHLHRLPLDLLPQIYAHHSSGMLELELSDWKIHRTYRVAAMDNGLFSFVDVKHGTWPVILVTNPKPAETVQPTKEPIVLMTTSSYIRLLVYSPSPIQLCEVRINEGPWMTCNLTGKTKPLYTTLWNPNLYSEGKHVLEAKAKDSSGALKLVKFEFSLDGTRSEFSSFFGQLFLKIKLTSLCFGAFYFLIIALVLPFWIIRCFQKQCPTNWFHRKMWIFATTDILFYPFLFYTLVWLPVLPWFIGYVTDVHIGYVFAWGTFVNGHFVLGTLSYFYGCLHMLSFNLPIIFILANAADLRYQQLVILNGREETFLRDWLAAIIFLSLQLFINYLFAVCFGAMATLLNPMRTWSLLLAVYLWLKVMNRTQSAWDLICWFTTKFMAVY